MGWQLTLTYIFIGLSVLLNIAAMVNLWRLHRRHL